MFAERVDSDDRADQRKHAGEAVVYCFEGRSKHRQDMRFLVSGTESRDERRQSDLSSRMLIKEAGEERRIKKRIRRMEMDVQSEKKSMEVKVPRDEKSRVKKEDEKVARNENPKLQAFLLIFKCFQIPWVNRREKKKKRVNGRKEPKHQRENTRMEGRLLQIALEIRQISQKKGRKSSVGGEEDNKTTLNWKKSATTATVVDRSGVRRALGEGEEWTGR